MSPIPSLTNGPTSTWHSVADWVTFEAILPPTYVYRLRAVDELDNPLLLHRLGRDDNTGLLYIGHTGADKRNRVAILARECCDKKSYGHGAGKRLYDQGTHIALRRICMGYKLQVGWDEVEGFNGPANCIESSGEDHSLTTFQTSAKEMARHEENRLLREYSRQYGELPPLNQRKGEYMRNKDEGTGNDIADDMGDD
jgi:hypothetical protein